MGPDIPGLTPELPVSRKFPERTSGANFWTPTREKNAKDLAKNFLDRIFRTKDRKFRPPRKFPGETSGANFRNPSREKHKKDLAEKRKEKTGPELPGAGISGLRVGTSTPQKNSRNCKTKTGISFASGLRFRRSWACTNRNNELYKNIRRKIIVQHVRRKT